MCGACVLQVWCECGDCVIRAFVHMWGVFTCACLRLFVVRACVLHGDVARVCVPMGGHGAVTHASVKRENDSGACAFACLCVHACVCVWECVLACVCV